MTAVNYDASLAKSAEPVRIVDGFDRYSISGIVFLAALIAGGILFGPAFATSVALVLVVVAFVVLGILTLGGLRGEV